MSLDRHLGLARQTNIRAALRRCELFAPPIEQLHPLGEPLAPVVGAGRRTFPE
ncbi:MAG: hypothetical protein ACREV9_05305 [Burkholderiales bacterium]